MKFKGEKIMKKIEIFINGHLYQGNYDILKDALDKLEKYRKTSFLSKPFIASEVETVNFLSGI